MDPSTALNQCPTPAGITTTSPGPTRRLSPFCRAVPFYARTVQIPDRRMVRPSALRIDDGSPGHEGPGALDDVVDLRHLIVLDGGLGRLGRPVNGSDSYLDLSNIHDTNLLIGDAVFRRPLQRGLNVIVAHMRGRALWPIG